MEDGIEQVFTCRIFSTFYYIKLHVANKLINIIVIKTSKKGRNDVEYKNYYSLCHLQEINSYFRIFNNIKDIYRDLLKIIRNKNFVLEENDGKTLSLIIKVQINDKIKNIVLTLVRNKSNYNYYINEKKRHNTIDVLNYELNEMKNRLDELEVKQTYPCFQSSRYRICPNLGSTPKMKINKLEKIFDKLNKLENENEIKTEKIKILENKLNLYENSSIINNRIDYDYKRNVYSNFINKNNNDSFNNDLKQSGYNKPYNCSIYSDNFEGSNLNNSNWNNVNRRSRYHSLDKNHYDERTNRFDNSPNRTRQYLSSDVRYNERSLGNISQIKNDDYYNEIPIFKRENILNLNSRIIFRIKEIQLLMRKLSGGEPNKVQLHLLYRASRDGDSDEIIRVYCQDKLNTLTLFYTTEGARFGVYTEKYIKKSTKKGDHWREVPGSSFIISLNNLVYYNVMAKKTSLNHKIDNMLCFGFCSRINNNETNFLIYTSRNNFLGRRYLFGDKNDVYLNLNYKKIVGNDRSYKIKDVEIFEVVVESL